MFKPVETLQTKKSFKMTNIKNKFHLNKSGEFEKDKIIFGKKL